MKKISESTKELWGAWVRFPREEGNVEFNYSPMEIEKHYPDMLKMKYPYFTSSLHSTRYFEENMLDREYEITGELTVFYSTDRESCLKWLNDKRNGLLQSYKSAYERLERSEVKAKDIEGQFDDIPDSDLSM